ncbi:DUF1376 domain-containing protein [Bartonella machadoae]|uniref:DUF1376 domain-containing protein n=1 Tax=Bartonella machadoae TaxID=2893471 RepID=UPI001F4D2FAA|nr:DUF1376 domain-containing protein [Bartonella machadoae]UNE54927.1 YdaU family protein [Bartonella machadoae]UNE55337.1 YdaU family protein [Bartonella machadoae]
MLTKFPWTRLFADKWLLDIACLPAIECAIYLKLRLQMLYVGEPILNDTRALSHFTGCSVKRFEKALEYLLETGHLILQDDGHLWSFKVGEELESLSEELGKYSLNIGAKGGKYVN